MFSLLSFLQLWVLKQSNININFYFFFFTYFAIIMSVRIIKSVLHTWWNDIRKKNHWIKLWKVDGAKTQYIERPVMSEN